MNAQRFFVTILMLIALTAFAQAQTSQARAYFDYGDRYWASQRYNEALPYYNEAQRLAYTNPIDMQVLLSLTWRYLALRDERAAWACFDKVTTYAYQNVTQHPDWSRGWLRESVNFYTQHLAGTGVMRQAGTSQATITAFYNRAVWIQGFLGGNMPTNTQGEANTSLSGTTLTYYPRPGAGQCQADCANNPNCKGSTWIQAGTYKAGDPAMCYLLSAVTRRNTARGHISLVKGGTSTGSTLPPSVAGTGRTDWGTTARGGDLQPGQRYSCNCPSGGGFASVWGSDIYTDDSSICLAAVHAGLITPQAGGTVVIELRPGQQSYTGSTRNGVSTKNYGNWERSFVFVRP